MPDPGPYSNSRSSLLPPEPLTHKAAWSIASAVIALNMLTNGLMLIVMLTTMLNQITSNFDAKYQHLDARIRLHDGEAALIQGGVCIIKSQTLENPELAHALVSACITAHGEPDKP